MNDNMHLNDTKDTGNKSLHDIASMFVDIAERHTTSEQKITTLEYRGHAENCCDHTELEAEAAKYSDNFDHPIRPTADYDLHVIRTFHTANGWRITTGVYRLIGENFEPGTRFALGLSVSTPLDESFEADTFNLHVRDSTDDHRETRAGREPKVRAYATTGFAPIEMMLVHDVDDAGISGTGDAGGDCENGLDAFYRILDEVLTVAHDAARRFPVPTIRPAQPAGLRGVSDIRLARGLLAGPADIIGEVIKNLVLDPEVETGQWTVTEENRGAEEDPWTGHIDTDLEDGADRVHLTIGENTLSLAAGIIGDDEFAAVNGYTLQIEGGPYDDKPTAYPPTIAGAVAKVIELWARDENRGSWCRGRLDSVIWNSTQELRWDLEEIAQRAIQLTHCDPLT